MNKRYALAALATAAVTLPLIGVGIATADEGDTADFTNTQNPGQAGTSVVAILDELIFQGEDALNGDNRPDGANGVENEFPPVDPRYIEGPVGGVLNGPFD
jgi:hypothetical protein